jgi:hypothetical protein
VIHNLAQPSVERLTTIAENHFPDDAAKSGALFKAVAQKVVAMRDGTSDPSQPPPSTAEYLDAVRACLQFQLMPDESPMWKAISSAVLAKRTQGAV